jgi:hypothetical protein
VMAAPTGPSRTRGSPTTRVASIEDTSASALRLFRWPPVRAPEVRIFNHRAARALRPTVGHLGDRSLLRALTWTGGGDVAAKIALGGLTAIAGRRMDSREFALMVGFIASGALSAAVWDLGVSTLLTREVASDRVSVHGGLRQALVIRLWSWPAWLFTYVLSAFLLLGAPRHYLLTAAVFAVSSVVSGVSIL